jgi:hypothetical protein
MIYRLPSGDTIEWPVGLGASIFGGGAPPATFHGGTLVASGGIPAQIPAAPSPGPSAPVVPSFSQPATSSVGALADSAPIPGGYVTWVAEAAAHNPGEFAAWLDSTDPWQVEVQGAHGQGGFGAQLREAILLWSNTNIRTVADLRAFLAQASAARGWGFTSDRVYAGDVTAGVPSTTILAPAPGPVIPTASTTPGRSTPTTVAPVNRSTPSAPTSIITPTAAAPVQQQATTGQGQQVSLPSNAIQPCVPVFNHEGSEFTCISPGGFLPVGYQIASVTLPNQKTFYAGVLPVFWVQLVQVGGSTVLQQTDFAGTMATLNGPHVPSSSILSGATAAPSPVLITPGPTTPIVRTVQPARPTTTLCADGYHLDIFTHACVPDDSGGTTPEACPAGFAFDQSGNCVPLNTLDPTNCPAGTQWNPGTQSCQVPISPGYTPPPTTTGPVTPVTPTTPAACIPYYNHEGSQFDCQPQCNSSYPLSQVTTPTGQQVSACLLPGFHLGIVNGAVSIIPPASTSTPAPPATLPVVTLPDGSTAPVVSTPTGPVAQTPAGNLPVVQNPDGSYAVVNPDGSQTPVTPSGSTAPGILDQIATSTGLAKSSIVLGLAAVAALVLLKK